MVEPEAMRSRVPQEFHEGSVLCIRPDASKARRPFRGGSLLLAGPRGCSRASNIMT